VPPRSGAAVAHDGDVVWIHYRGTLEDGTVFDSSLERDPLEFTLGAGAVIPGFDNAVRGMRVGEQKKVTIPADEAYGPYRFEKVLVIARAQLSLGTNPEVGQRLQLMTSSGGAMQVLVTEVTETSITVDANHPLAGEDLTFEIALVGIQ
jgi:peptidylprolyl isomerase